MKLFRLSVLGLLAASVFACTSKTGEPDTLSGLNRTDFQSTLEGKKTDLYTLTNAAGMEVCVTNYGARLVSVMTPDKNGTLRDVILGYQTLADYLKYGNNFGASIGRYANRIAGGRFELDGEVYQLPTNDHGHTLHGGPKGWDQLVWDVDKVDASSITLSLVSPDGDMGFPGTVNVAVTYTLTDDNAIDIAYEATTDRKTIINMTNHAYFNLSGDPTRQAMDHLLYVNASNFSPIDSLAIPLAEPMAVSGTPLDFTTPAAISERVDRNDFEPIRNGIGIDHNFLLDTGGDDAVLAGSLESPTSGIRLEVYTDEPGLQVYSGNYLDGTDIGKGGIAYQYRTAVCLESHHYPDSPNRPTWPSVVLEPGQTYHSHCIYRFSIKK